MDEVEHSELLFDSEQEVEGENAQKTPVQLEVEVVSTEDFEHTEESILDITNFEKEKTILGDSSTNTEKSLDSKPEKQTDKSTIKKEESSRYKPLHLPLARIKQIVKMDPDVHLAGSEAVFLIAKATELFIELLSKDAYAFTASAKKKTIQKKDVDSAIANADALIFLDGALDF